ncbi:MAG: ACP S-malonyltransferase [Archangiaceae bacterium]|nr:ACP S-malonyltransferase [Archangiaceae bacterium]
MANAVVFPGQGSQRAGMAKDFHACFAASREVFAEASEALGLDVRSLCFEGGERLDRTEYTQPALLTAELAMFRALERELGFTAAWFGGHSLGEYTALCAAGALPLAVAVRLVRRRGALMQQAVPVGQGAMAAVVAEGLAARDLSPVLEGLHVDVANHNAPDQLVLSGDAGHVEVACGRMRKLLHGAEHRIVPLNVSAPFHSRLMRRIEADFRDVLQAAAPAFDAPRAAAVTSNFTGNFHVPTREALVDALARQLSGSVDWVANMRALASRATRIFEVGPNRPLRGFFKALGHEVTAIVSERQAVAAFAAFCPPLAAERLREAGAR